MNWLFPDVWFWPWAFLLLAVPLFFLWFRGQTGSGPAVMFPPAERLAVLGKMVRNRPGWVRLLALVLGMSCLTFALARPQMVERLPSSIHSGVDVMLVLDATPTMLAEDFVLDGRRVSRVNAVVRLAGDFIDARPHDRIGLIYFAAYPSLLSPPTHNHAWLKESLRRVEVRPATAIGDAIASAANRLKDSDAASRVIVLLTDGDNNYGRLAPSTAAEAAGALGIRIHAVGIGSDHPVPIPGWGMAEAILDETTLRDVARQSNGRYFRAKSAVDLQAVFAEIDQLERTDFDGEEMVLPVDIPDVWLWGALAFLSVGFLSRFGLWMRPF
jgi:Ca-activated chloride channel family protein